MFACLELAQLQSVIYQYCEINLRATLSEGGGRMWPPGLQLPIYGLECLANTCYSATWFRAIAYIV